MVYDREIIIYVYYLCFKGTIEIMICVRNSHVVNSVYYVYNPNTM